MKKVTYIIIALIVLVGGYFLLNKKQTPASNEPIKIGIVGPFTGPSAHFGEFMNRGIELAMADLDPKIKDKIILVREDDKCTGQDAVSAVNKLIQLDKVKYVIGPLCNASTIATEKLFDDGNVLSLTSGVPSEQIGNMGDNHFTFSPEIKYLMQALSTQMRQQNYAKASILYVLDAFGEENYNQFKKSFEGAGGVIIGAEGVEKGAVDLRTQVLKLKAKKPDSIVIMLTGGSIVSALKEIQTQGIGNLPKFSIHSFQTPDVLSGAPSEAEGVVYPYPASSVSTISSDKYAENYLAKYNQTVELYSSNVYDSFTVLVNAIIKCGYDDTSCVKNNIQTTRDYDGASGLISLDDRGVVIFQQTMIKTVKGGKFVNLK